MAKTKLIALTALFDHTDERSNEFGTTNNDATMTQVSTALENDVSILMERFQRTGQLPQITTESPLYGDFTNVTDYSDAMRMIQEADDAFGEIPAHIRAQFENKPQAFMDFIQNPANADKLIEMGLATKRESPTAQPALQPEHNDGTQGPGGSRRTDGRPGGLGGTQGEGLPGGQSPTGSGKGGPDGTQPR